MTSVDTTRKIRGGALRLAILADFRAVKTFLVGIALVRKHHLLPSVEGGADSFMFVVQRFWFAAQKYRMRETLLPRRRESSSHSFALLQG